MRQDHRLAKIDMSSLLVPVAGSGYTARVGGAGHSSAGMLGGPIRKKQFASPPVDADKTGRGAT